MAILCTQGQRKTNHFNDKVNQSEPPILMGNNPFMAKFELPKAKVQSFSYQGQNYTLTITQQMKATSANS